MAQDPVPVGHLRERLLVLATRFRVLAKSVTPPPVPGEPGEQGVFAEVAPDTTELLRQKAFRDLQDARREAGEVLILLSNQGVLADGRLATLVAASELDAWGPFGRTPANLFVIYLGGPVLLLEDEDGQTAYYEALGDQCPPQIRRQPSENPIREAVRLALGDPVPNGPELCQLYAEACDRIASLVPAAELSISAAATPAEGSALAPSHQAAYDAYNTALEKNPELQTDDQVYEWVRDNLGGDEYQIPDNCETFKAYLRRARQTLRHSEETPNQGSERSEHSPAERYWVSEPRSPGE